MHPHPKDFDFGVLHATKTIAIHVLARRLQSALMIDTLLNLNLYDQSSVVTSYHMNT